MGEGGEDMKLRLEYMNKYITATTRKANYVDIYFAKYTIWKSRKAFTEGDCEEVIEISNLYLGNNTDNAIGIVLNDARKHLEKGGWERYNDPIPTGEIYPEKRR